MQTNEEEMKKLVLVGMTIAALSLAALSPADASGGCGPYRHRGVNGLCYPGGGWAPPVYVGGYGWHRHWGPGWGYGWRHRW
jgi:hypothetical protein